MRVATVEYLVEREEALVHVRASLEAAANGSGATLVLDAPAGLGKSSVLEHAVLEARSDDLLVLRARGDELGRHVPYGVLQQLFARHVRELDERDRLLLGASPAAPLLSAIGIVQLDEALTPQRVAAGLWWLLESLTEEHEAPALVVVDDLHWADSASLIALAYLSARIDGMRCAMLLAQRDTDASADAAVNARLRCAPSTTIVALKPLTQLGSIELAQSIAPNLDADQARAAHAATGGNPFLLSELVRHVDPVCFTASTWEFASHDPVPPRVLDHARLQLANAPADAAVVAASVAALGQWATIARAAAVAQLPLTRTELLIDVLTEAGVVTRVDEGCGYCHPLVQAAMLTVAVSDGERRQLARRAAAVLYADRSDAAAIASVLLDAPTAGDVWTSTRLVEGAQAALDAGAPAEALRFLDRAINEPIFDTAELTTVWRMVARARTAGGDAAGAISAMEAALALIEDPALRSDLRVELANAHIGMSDIVGAMREFNAAADELRDVAGAYARTVMLRASSESFGRFIDPRNDGTDPILQAVPHDPAEDRHEHRILLANAALTGLFANRDHQRVRDHARRALAGTTLLEEATSDGRVPFAALGALTWSDDFAHGLPILDAAVDDARRRGSVLAHATASSARGGALFRRGDLVRAAADLQAAIAARHDGWSTHLPITSFYVAHAYLALGDTHMATALVEASEFGDDLSAWGPVEPFAHAALAVAAGARDDDRAALQHFTDALDAERRQRATVIGFADWRQDMIELAAVRFGRGAEYAELADETLELARSFGAPRALGRSLRAVARLTSDPDAQVALLDEAIEVLDSGDVPYELARTLYVRGELELARTDAVDAAPHFERALELAHVCGARRLLAALASRGVTVRTPRAHDQLTPSEVRVAELAAAGMTNREIAQALFVTVKAVEWHLSNSYRKLSIAGRSELGAALA